VWSFDIYILALDTEIKYHQKWERGGEDIKKEGSEIKEEKEGNKIFKYLVANAALFIILFHRLLLIRVHFAYSNFLWGIAWGCGPEVA
jgi:hypothetical protein